MEHTTSRSLSLSDRVYRGLLHLYPSSYLEAHGDEMLQDFQDLKRGMTSHTSLWAFVIKDFVISLSHQYMESIKRSSQINGYSVTGLLLLTPLFAMLAVDFISRIAQGDLSHVNGGVSAILQTTPLYWAPILFTWVFLFPLLAFLLGAMSVIRYGDLRNPPFSVAFLKQNLLSIGVVIFALFFLILIRFHDYAPCVAHGVLSQGMGQIGSLLESCRGA